MSPPIPDVPLQGREAYVWAWLLHGSIANAAWSPEWEDRVRLLYPRTMHGWARGRLTLRAGAAWARGSSERDIVDARQDALAAAPEVVRPKPCECGGLWPDDGFPCGTCHGSGMVHAYQEATP